MNCTKKFISFFLLLLISVFVVPKELIHTLVDHNDTEDIRTVPNAPLSIEHQHTHCEFLKLNVPLYFSDFKFFQAELPYSYFIFETFNEQSSIAPSFQLPALRGPPSFHFFDCTIFFIRENCGCKR